LIHPVEPFIFQTMKAVAVTFRILLKILILVAMVALGLTLVGILLPFLFPVALLLGVLVVLRFCWRMLTPRPRCCGACAVPRR